MRFQFLLPVWPKASCGAIPLFWLCSLLLGSCLHLQVVLLLLKLAPCCSGSGVPPSLSEWIVAGPMLTTCWIPSAAFRLQERQVLQILLHMSQIQFKTWRHPRKEPGRLAQEVVLQSLVRTLTVIMVARTSAATLILWKTWAMIGGPCGHRSRSACSPLSVRTDAGGRLSYMERMS